jgi:hypothetical protein
MPSRPAVERRRFHYRWLAEGRLCEHPRGAEEAGQPARVRGEVARPAAVCYCTCPGTGLSGTRKMLLTRGRANGTRIRNPLLAKREQGCAQATLERLARPRRATMDAMSSDTVAVLRCCTALRPADCLLTSSSEGGSVNGLEFRLSLDEAVAGRISSGSHAAVVTRLATHPPRRDGPLLAETVPCWLMIPAQKNATGQTTRRQRRWPLGWRRRTEASGGINEVVGSFFAPQRAVVRSTRTRTITDGRHC